MSYKVEVELEFDKITESLERELEQAINNTVLHGERVAKQNAPVDTGHLRRSISSETNGLEGELFTNVEYAPFVEYGTSNQSAQPFMLPAQQEMEKKLNDEVAKAIAKGLKNL